MNIFQNRYRDWLVPYVEGTLDARRRAILEARLAQDPILAAEAEAERRVAARLRETAQSAGSAVGEQSLWPSIQARLEPRRPSIRPLILVGGLSAAMATLIGAALWGPLKPSSPVASPTKVASGMGAPPVIIVVPPPVRVIHHTLHGHHGESNRGKRNAVPHLLTVPEPDGSRDETQPQDRLAVNQSVTPERTSADGSAMAPKFTPDSGDFHLATNQRSGRDRTTPDGALPDTSAAPGNNDTSQDGTGSSETPLAHPDPGTTETPSEAPVVPSTASVPKATGNKTHHRQRQRRHHSRAAHAPVASETEHGGTAQSGPNGSVSSQGTAALPKSGTKPVD